MVKRKTDETKKPTAFVQVACIIALVALTFIDAEFPEFEVSLIVYGILGGVLLGVSNVTRIFK